MFVVVINRDGVKHMKKRKTRVCVNSKRTLGEIYESDRFVLTS